MAQNTRGSADTVRRSDVQPPRGSIFAAGDNIAVQYGTRWYLGKLVEFAANVTPQFDTSLTIPLAVKIHFYCVVAPGYTEVALCNLAVDDGVQWLDYAFYTNECMIKKIDAVPTSVGHEEHDPEAYVSLTTDQMEALVA